jgi:hypothetical protein
MNDEVNIGDLHAFVMECLPKAPVARRISLLRTLAAVIGDARLATQLRDEARDLELIERQHAAILAHFRKNGKNPPHDGQKQ